MKNITSNPEDLKNLPDSYVLVTKNDMKNVEIALDFCGRNAIIDAKPVGL